MPVLPFVPSSICLGSCGFGTSHREDQVFRLLDRFVELGGNIVDSAHCYDFWQPGGEGVPERTIGRWLKRTGYRLIIATKGGHPGAGPHYRRPDRFLSPETISRDVSDSLERLGVETIDLYYLHRDDGVTPEDEIMDSLLAEVEKGRVRALGASNWSLSRLADANLYAQLTGRVGFAALQNQWSLGIPSWEETEDPTVRRIEADQLGDLKSMGLTLFPYSATSNGFFATGGTRGDAFITDANRARLERVQKLAEAKGCSANQIALAWLLNQDLPVVPTVGTGNLNHLEDALAASRIKLTPDESVWLRGEG